MTHQSHPHIEALRSRHMELSHRIEAEQKLPLPNEIRLRELKSLKLRLKDEISGKSAQG